MGPDRFAVDHQQVALGRGHPGIGIHVKAEDDVGGGQGNSVAEAHTMAQVDDPAAAMVEMIDGGRQGGLNLLGVGVDVHQVAHGQCQQQAGGTVVCLQRIERARFGADGEDHPAAETARDGSHQLLRRDRGCGPAQQDHGEHREATQS